jgi:CspA family cold shock protein
LATGRVLQFDKERGYGFIAADDGGEDIFLHASVYDGDSYELSPGTRIEFKVMAGDRGRKAFAARIIPDEPDPVDGSVTPAESASKALDGPSVPPSPASQPASAASMGSASQTPAPQTALDEHMPDDETMCDVLSREEFGQELAELLLANAPTLTGQEILQVRESMLECARKHGWIDI